MATHKVCDKCGKSCACDNVDRLKGWRRVEIGMLDGFQQHGGPPQKFDLCDDCIRPLLSSSAVLLRGK